VSRSKRVQRGLTNTLTRINRKSAYLSRLQRGSELKFEVPKVKESLRSVYSDKVDRISQIRNSISKSLNLLILKQDMPEPNRSILTLLFLFSLFSRISWRFHPDDKPAKADFPHFLSASYLLPGAS